MSAFVSDVPLHQLDEATFSGAGRSILAPLSLRLEPARLYGIVRRNGSGKSSLVRMLARQQAPSGGSIHFLGRDFAGFGDRGIARSLAYMPQFMPPAESMTVRELVGLGRFPWHGRSAASATRITPRSRKHCGRPTSALDIAHQVEMRALVRELSRERGLGVLVVLHDMNMAARYCDEILALGEGRLVARGTPAEIMDPGMLASIYGIAMGTLATPGTAIPIAYVL